jgi:hypothetical protein
VMPRGQHHGFRIFGSLLWVDSSIGKRNAIKRSGYAQQSPKYCSGC